MGKVEQELSPIIIVIFDDEEWYCTTSYCSPRKNHAQSKGEKKKIYALEITQPLTSQNNNGAFLKKGLRVDGEWRLPSAKLFCDRFMKTIYIM